MASAILLYGFTLLYGFSGTTDLYQIPQSLTDSQAPIWGIIGSLVLILVGFGFKISAVPMHFWAPDVYEGAPTPVTGFLSTASKAAGFLILMRVLFVVYPSIVLQWSSLIAAISVATMTIGNLLALAQKNIKRMLAYSSIAHAGYALIGIATMSGLGITSTIFYLIAYLITNLAAFGVVTAYGNVIHSDEIKDYAGMSRRAPGLALIMLVAFLSLAGMPPLAGFIAKFMVFAAAIQANQIWLAVVGIINTIIGLYYYLVVLKVVYLYRSEGDEQPARMSPAITFALVILVIGILLIGTAFSPIFNWSFTAASGMF
jgi:NADH-quinone oxidoreductase subunit N